MAIIRLPHSSGAVNPVKIKNTGVNATNSSEPRDTYFVITIATMAIMPAISAGQNASVAMTPIVVAMPFPPRKWKYSGQLCPIMAAIPQATATHVPQPPAQVPSQTAAIPFSTSRTSTRIAGPFPITRSVLVAPAFPLPYCRISTPLSSRTSSTLKLTEPSR
ncbi:hypothetical protein D3C76_1446010 [compost metagenome]